MHKITSLEQLANREMIKEIVYLYGYALDQQQWQLYESLFEAEIYMDYSASIGQGHSGLQKFSAAQWVQNARQFFEQLTATQHLLIPRFIRLDDNQQEAVVNVLLQANHYWPQAKGDSIQRMIAEYDMKLRKQQDETWRIYESVQSLAWNEGNWQIFEHAMQSDN